MAQLISQINRVLLLLLFFFTAFELLQIHYVYAAAVHSCSTYCKNQEKFNKRQGQVTYIIIFIYQLTFRLHFNSAPIMLNFSKFHYYGIKIPPASPYIVIVATTLKNKSRCKYLKLSPHFKYPNSEFRTQIYLLRS